jgi:glycine/D-amino acid oxidase-like deaminating enzyme
MKTLTKLCSEDSSTIMSVLSWRLILLLTISSSLTAMGFSAPKNIVVVGGGIQGTSVAYHLFKKCDKGTRITILESKEPASAASGKGGGFMARSWGNGSPTQRLHELAFDMYPTICKEIGCTSYRKLPVLSVSPGYKGIQEGRKRYGDIMPDWLDGEVGRISPMGRGDDTAQVTPHEFVHKMLDAAGDRIQLVLGTCIGVETNQGPGTSRKVTAVKYRPRKNANTSMQEVEADVLLEADAVIVSAGPWSCSGEDWFQGAVDLPMEGIKSTSIVWKKPDGVDEVDATALFCGEDDRFGTHCK